MLEANTSTPRDLFDGKVQYEIPAFQRPYVWNESDQWSPLWEDIRRVAESQLDSEDGRNRPPHFLGAIVIKSSPPVGGGLVKSSVIDGQQRMTTLQILLNAAHTVISRIGDETNAEALGELVENGSSRFKNTNDRFKLLPSRTDQAAFVSVMSSLDDVAFSQHGIVMADRFFQKEIQTWLNTAGISTIEARIGALCETLSERLFLVVINIGESDDDQLIFETLNDRGTPLLAADLVKNWVFQKGDSYKCDTEKWQSTYWDEFDDPWWRTQISQGRHLRSRIDIFIQYWLTFRTRDEILTEGLFRSFRNYAQIKMSDAKTSEAFLGEFRNDAKTFKALGDASQGLVAQTYYHNVVETFEIASTLPLLMWLLSTNHQVSEAQVSLALVSLESWIIRRTLLGLTMKDVNRTMVSVLRKLDETSVQSAGEIIRDELLQQTADSRLWPTDDLMIERLPQTKLYGNIRQPRIRIVLEAIEMQLRTSMHEPIQITSSLEIEHVMPRSWREHWGHGINPESQEANRRNRLVDTLGNLTLVTKKLNASLSNQPWVIYDPSTLAVVGGKRQLIHDYSLLVMNRLLYDEHPTQWTDNDIEDRGESFARLICKIWPYPASTSGIGLSLAQT